MATSTREVVKAVHYKAGYEVRTERFSGPDYGVPEDESFMMRSAFTSDGEYIGTPKDARVLIVKRGIRPEKADPGHSTCSIGFCERDRKWYGWSHRALCGFGIGDKLFDAFWESADDHTPFVAHGDVTIETLEQARQAASGFADMVS